MGFPEDFKIDSNKGNAYKQCGNSVVIPMIFELAKSIMRQAFDNGGKYGHFGNDLYCPFVAPFKISTINLKKML